jgi:N12 class adenine-specific DNA methylase
VANPNPFFSSPYDKLTEDLTEDAAKTAAAASRTPEPKEEVKTKAPNTENASAPRAAGTAAGAPTRDDVIRRAQELDVDPRLALSIWSQESGRNANVRDSAKGARGGFQVMPGTFKAMLGDKDQRDPWNNMEAGLRYIAYGQKTLGTKDPALLAAGYHAGYDRDSLKRGEIPDVTDGKKRTRDYAREVASRAGGKEPEVVSDSPGFPKMTPLSDAEAVQFQQTGKIDNRFVPLSDEETNVFLAQNKDNPALKGFIAPKQAQPTPMEAKAPDRSFFDEYVGDPLKRGWASLKQSTAATGAMANARQLEVIGRIDRGEKVPDQEDMAGYQYMNAEQRAEYKAMFADAFKRGAERTAELGKEIEAIPQDPIVAKANQAKSFGDWWDAFKQAPMKVIAQTGVESLPQMVPGLVLGGGAGAAAKIGLKAGGVAAGAAGMGAGSYAVDYPSTVLSVLADKGVDVRDPNALSKAFSDPKLMEQVGKEAHAHASVVGAMDAVSGGVASKALVPGKTIARQAGNLAAQTVTQGALGAAGEAGGQVAQGKDSLEWGSIMGEFAGEFAGAPVEVAGAAKLKAKEAVEARREAAAEQAGAGVTPTQERVEPAMQEPAPAPASAAQPVPESAVPSKPTETPLTSAVENAAAAPDRAVVTAPNGVQAVANVQGYVENPDGSFAAQLVDDDGNAVTLTDKDGVKIAPVAPESGPLTSSVEKAAAQEAQATPTTQAQVAAPEPQQINDLQQQAAPQVAATSVPTPAAAAPEQPAEPRPAKVEPPKLADMTDAQLRDRMKYLAGQFKNAGDRSVQTKIAVERRAIEREINARAIAAPADTPKAETPAAPEPTEFKTRADANAAMLRAAERTGQPHEVVERGDQFAIQPIQEAGDADARNDDGRGRGAGGADRSGTAVGDGAVSDRDVRDGRGDVAGDARPGDNRIPEGDADAGRPADAKPALTEAPAAEKDAHAGKWFGSREKADAYLGKKKIVATHEVVQTGKVRFEVRPKAAVQIEAAAQESATSEQNDLPAPTEAQIEAGNYKKGHIAVQGLDITVENPRGSKRSGTDPDGKAWETTMNSHYGYIKRTVGADGEHVDVFVGDKPDAGNVFIVDQANPATQEFDEHKVMVGFGTLEEAKAAYLANYDKDWKGKGFKAISTMPVADFKEWLKAGDTSKPFAPITLGKKKPTAEKVPEVAPAPANDDAPAAPPAAEAAAPVPAVKDKNAIFAQNKLFTADAVEKARARMKSKMGQLNSGLDPELMVDGVTLAGAYIEAGVRKFADFAKAMTDDFGDKITPYLLSFYEGVRHYPGLDTDGMSTPRLAQSQHEAMMLELTEGAKTQTSPTMDAKEAKTDDTNPSSQDDRSGAEGQAAEPVRADEGERDAGAVRGEPGGERAGAGAGDTRRAGKRPAVPEDQRSDGEGAGSERPAESRDRDGAGAGDRADQRERVSNYRIAQGELTRAGSWRATAERNIGIVELVKKIQAEGRAATAEERAQLVKFTGWGASEIANGVFPDRYGRFKNAEWQALGERLKAALTDEEYAQARRTTQYAHYTSESVIRSIYAGLDRLGFKGGTLIEPGMGVGHFAGLMPDHMAANSSYTGIEYEPITGAIAKLLYPQSNVIVGDFTKTSLPRDFFDMAIGNPPFSSSQVLNDPEYKGQRPMLHDYFFMKTIDRVKPGGLLVFVTSKGTMDKTSDKSRKYLAERGNLLGAIRLPQTAFKDNAGTEVVTDVIFLQKRGEGIPDNGVKWLGTKEVATPQGPTPINEYFADHPEMVLGRHALEGSMYRANEYTVLPLEGDIEQHFAEAVKRLPENVSRPARGSLAERALVQDRDFNPTHKKEGGLYVTDGKLMQVESGSGVELTHRAGADGKPIALTPKQKAWLKGYVGVRDALKQAQFDQLNDGNWKKSLKALNAAYDAFVAEHGPILDYTTITRETEEGTVETKRLKNAPLFQADVEGALVYALESIKEDGSIVKGVALSERVLERSREPEIKTTNDAMFVSLNRNGVLDLDDVAKLAGTDRESVIRDLGTAIYDAPGKGYQLADEYLSGNVVKKLAEAQAAAEINPAYKRNVEALLAVQPRPLGPTEITVRLGANWVPASDIAAFAQDALGDKMDVTYSPITGQWNVEQQTYGASEWSFNKMSAGDILASVLNARQLKVTFRDQEGKTHTDLEATEKANDIAGKMRERFRTWLWSDPKRADRLVKHYNQHFNNIAPRAFDGSHLTLPGVSSRYKLHPHQKRAVWRVVQQGDTYLAHAVGAGKTMEMIASGMEERRLGLIQKPMYVVPNHMLAQFAREFLELYPAANIMVADENNFHTHNRKRFVAQAALNNPDAIVITHSAFGRIGMSEEFSAKFINDQIEAWKSALEDVDKGDRVTVKQIERRIEQLERRLEGKQGKDKKDQVLTFEELGVDKLYVDEFHEFRKLDFATNQGNVKGIDPAGSQRSLDLYMKVEYLRGKKPGRSLVAASGTPVTNTMGELFTAQRFFQPDQLKEDGLDTFDAWSAQYGDIVTGFEQNAAGGYEMVNRFAKFQNVPELMRRVRSFMDILTSSNLGALVKRPDVIGGGRQVKVTPVPEGYKEYQQTLQSRIKAIRERKGPPKKGEDIILNVIGDGRFSAIDMRFVDPTRPSDPNSKLNVWIDDIIAAYRETAGHEYSTGGKVDPLKGSTIVGFTDIGLGEQSAASRGFDMKAWIEKRLADAGIPREHVAFMRDHKQHAKKERLFADMREGKRRILIGGKDMETGVNVQKRLTHLFHLDAPWFPSSVEQREGRAVRQGNQNQEVTLAAYATKGSYDSTMWGMNARKARFIEQAMNGDDSVRSMDDVSEASAFEMASALASGDERYLKMAGLKADVERFERLRHAHYSDQNSLRREKHWNEEAIGRGAERIAELESAIKRRKPIRAGEFAGTVGKATFDSRDEFSEALFKAFKKAAEASETEKVLGEIGGFPITFHGIEMKGSGDYMAILHVGVPGDPAPILNFPFDADVAVAGLATRAANQVNGLDKDLAQARARVDEAKRKVEQIGKRLGAAFPEEQILLEKVAELSALQEELAKEGEQASADAAAATVEVDAQPETDAGEPRYSVKDGVTEAEFGPVHTEYRDDPAGAIARLMADKTGEAIVNVPTLGDVSLIYGDEKTGLGHIARRRGAEFMGRLPDLLKNGALYSKPGQKGRVFLGTDRDEAVVRFDWDGKAKTWLLSAYEKYPDGVKPAAAPQASRRSQVLEERSAPWIDKDGLKKAITGGMLGQVIHSMIDAGVVVLHNGPSSLPKGLGKNVRGIQAVTAPDGKIHMVASNLAAQNARAVMLHEAFHKGGERLIGTAEWSKMMGRLGSLYRQSEQSGGAARAFFDRARARVADAKGKGAVKTSMEVEEFAAYAIEEYESDPRSLPAAIRKWVEDIIGLVKTWFVQRFGKQLGEVTPAQLAAMAKLAIMDVAVARKGEIFGPLAEVFSVAGANGQQVELTPPEDTSRLKLRDRFGDLQSAIQDNMNRVKQVQNRITKLAGRVITEASDYYGAETNRPGRIAARLEDAEKHLFAPLMQRLAKSGHTQAELEELLHAMHAQERNEAVAKINPAMPDGGSGMKTADAAKILARYAGKTELHAMAQQARDIARATLDLKLAYGLIDGETHAHLSEMYEHYVPLKGDGEYGPKVKRAMGHEEREEHILENIARDYDQAVVVGEKNLARQSLLRLVLNNPDPDLWTVGVPPKGRYVAGKVYNLVRNGQTEASFTSRAQVDAFLEAKGPSAVNYQVQDSAGEQVREFVRPLQENEVMVYVKGDPVRIQIMDERLARQIRPLDGQKLGFFLEKARGINRYLSKIYTGYNPAFILRNATRDAMTGTINMIGHQGAVTAAKAWTKYPQAAKALAQWAATGKAPAGEFGQMLTEYRQHGGKTGASYMSDLEQQAKTLTRLFDDAYGAAAYAKDGRPGKAAMVAGRKIIGGMAHVVEIANQATENALRLALYMQLREQGVSPGKAAQAAKTVTVDFDRKGSQTGALGALYLFFNPAVQGASNAIKTLAQGEHKQQAWAALGALALLGVYAAASGMDDDKDRWLGEGWETRSKNLILNIGGRQFRLPLSQEFAPVYGFGVAMTEAARGESKMSSAVRVVSSFIDAYFPFQGAFQPESDNHALDLALAATPTVLKTPMQTAVNRNSFGSQIVPENEFTKDRPDNLKMNRATKNTAYDKTAQGIAWAGEVLTGAGKYENDITKVSPETLKNLWRTYTGGLGTFVTDTIGVAGMTATAPGQVELPDVPIVKDFVKAKDARAIRGRFYELGKEARRAAYEFKQADKAGDVDEMRRIMGDPEKSRLLAVGDMVSKVSKDAAEIRDLAVDVNADESMTAAEKRAKLKDLDQQEEAIYRQAIEAFK